MEAKLQCVNAPGNFCQRTKVVHGSDQEREYAARENRLTQDATNGQKDRTICGPMAGVAHKKGSFAQVGNLRHPVLVLGSASKQRPVWPRGNQIFVERDKTVGPSGKKCGIGHNCIVG